MERSQMNVADEVACHCDNCDWTGTAYDTLYIHDLHERLDPGGGTVPAGECPECESLAYVTNPDTPARRAIDLIDQFWKTCEDAEYTDVGQVWEVFDLVRKTLRGGV